MKDRRIHLKVKVKSLAEEARIIRSEASKTSDSQLKNSLHFHRIGIVRSESRHSLLAYGFMHSRPYECMEQKCDVTPDWNKIRNIATRFGPTYAMQPCESTSEFGIRHKQYKDDLDNWVVNAKSHCIKST